MIRTIALDCKNALFAVKTKAASPRAEAPLIETYKTKSAELFAYLKATLTAIANGHPQSHFDDLLPSNFKASSLADYGPPRTLTQKRPRCFVHRKRLEPAPKQI